MEENIISEGKFKYVEFGEGNPIVILHGLMGGLSNFSGVIDFFPKNKSKSVYCLAFLVDVFCVEASYNAIFMDS